MSALNADRGVRESSMSVPRRTGGLAAMSAFLLFTGGAFGRVGDAGDSAAIDFRKTVNLSPQETLSQSRDYQTKMQETKRRIELLQERAKKDKDVIKLNCVN